MRGAVLMVNLSKTEAEREQEKEKAATADDPKAGADVGKIVHLIAGILIASVILFSLSHRLTEWNHWISQAASGFYLILGGISLLPLPNARLLTYNQRSAIRDPDCWCVLVPVSTYPHPSLTRN